MASKKLEELTTDQLKKKDKEKTKLLIFFAIIYSVCFIWMLILRPNIVIFFTPALIALLPLANGRKKIREELKKRVNQA